VLERQPEQVHVGQLAIALQPRGQRSHGFNQADVVRPELVGGMREIALQQAQGVCRRQGIGREGRVRHDPHEGELRERARRPPHAATPRREPLVGSVEVLVSGPEQSDEHVDVEEGRPQGTSSRRVSTAAEVTRELPFGRRTNVRPWRSVVGTGS
jgi:hypothetical protein